jgi:peptide/nickel transport system substrate-binding protein
MAHRPRWLNLAAVGMAAALTVMACQQAAAPTTAPVGTTAPATPTAGTPVPPGSPTGGGEQYPPDASVECATDAGPGSYNGEEYVGKVRLIEAPDPMTVVFNLCSTDVAFLQKMAFSPFAINDADWLETHTADGTHVTTMNGTGPYRLDEWRTGDSILYSRFDEYWGEPAVNAGGVLRWASESAQRLNELRAGTIDGMTLVGPTDFEAVEGDATLQLATPPGGTNLNVFYLGMNHNVAPWDNQLVRQAVSYAIDKQRLVDNFYPPGSETSSYFTPCALEFGCEGDPFPEFDPDRARELLTEAGFPDGLDTVLQFRPAVRGYLPQPPQIAEELQAQLADVGIRTEIEQHDDAEYITESNTGQLHGLFMLGWGADYPEITNFLDFHFGQGCTSSFGKCYPEIADPLARGSSTTDEETRRAAYAEANGALVEQVPMVPLAHGAFANAYLAGVEGGQASPLSNEQLFRMTPAEGDTITFMQNSEPGSVFCADETDGEALRPCEQSMEGLYIFETNGTEPVPALATSCDPNEDGSVWTCHLREGVTFHDGATFDSHDVIVSLASMWDAAHPLHVGKPGSNQYEYWGSLWDDYLNASQVPVIPEEPAPATPAPSGPASPPASAPASEPASEPASPPASEPASASPSG